MKEEWRSYWVRLFERRVALGEDVELDGEDGDDG